MNHILIIDDEEGIRNVLGDILEDEGYRVSKAAEGAEGLKILKSQGADLIFLDVWMPNMGGLDVLKTVKEDFPDLEVIMISGHGNIDMAVKAMKAGAYDFVEKPLSMDKILAQVQNVLRLENLKRENRELRNSLFMEDQIIGQSAAMKRVFTLVEQSAPTDSRVLILGENGTGKELVAREIHRRSPRSREAFVEVNCAAIPDALIESELFGHEKGAFTSAVARRKGKFELAHGGTLFLDEIADMSLSAQAKVLRAIQEMKFQRVGAEDTVTVDVRILAATNKNLRQEVTEGRFREDLYFRLNVIPIEVPPLRDRREDIPLLAEYFLRKFKSRSGGGEFRYSPGALEILAAYPWPGNIREFKNFSERVAVMTDEPEISQDTVSFYLESQGASAPKSTGRSWDDYKEMSLTAAREAFEKAFLKDKLEENEYNISRAAQALGIYPSGLHAKMKKYGLEK